MSWAEDEGYGAYWPEDMAPSINFKRGYWFTENHQQLRISNMDIQHIKNCIAHLERSKDYWDYLPEDVLRINNKIKEFKKELVKRSDIKGEKF